MSVISLQKKEPAKCASRKPSFYLSVCEHTIAYVFHFAPYYQNCREVSTVYAANSLPVSVLQNTPEHTTSASDDAIRLSLAFETEKITASQDFHKS